jgi:glycosyltransferase involved in cell wall biosynthesis
LWFDKFTKADVDTLPLSLETKQFLLYPANAWKHKNHLFLLDVLAYIRDKFNLQINVFFTGNFNSLNGQLIIEKSTQLNLQNQVLFFGVVEENILYSLYKQAVGVVIPTLYEAGSFPLMESILLNVPVICSNVTSLPETIGNVKFVFDPENLSDFSEKLIQFWEDEEFRKDNLKQLKLQSDILTKNDPFPTLQKLYAELTA